MIGKVTWDDNKAVKAAEILARHRLELAPFAGFPEGRRPPDLEAAYAVQTELRQKLEPSPWGKFVGYKIGCTTPVMQDYLKIDHPCAGSVFAGRLWRRRASIPRTTLVRPGVECEIALRLAADLGRGKDPRALPFDRESVAPAVGALMAAIELVDDRYRDWQRLDAPTLVADDFFAAGAVLGDEVADWQSLDLANLCGEMRIDGDLCGSGHGRDILGHPLEALAWLANLLVGQGAYLQAGTIVVLGSLVKTHWVDKGSTIEVSIAGLGQAALEIT
jgi:2-oxo-3-hexenedioate decarboxylase/2-keto-4-pentenoate hydratase